MIATNVNCNMRPGDYPVCRITAPIVLDNVKLANFNTSTTPAPTATPISNTGIPDNLPQAIPSPPAITTTHIAPQPATSTLTQAIHNLAISSTSQSHIASVTPQKQLSSLASTTFTPVARHTHSHCYFLTVISLSSSPLLVQAQAQAWCPNYSTHPVTRPAL